MDCSTSAFLAWVLFDSLFRLLALRVKLDIHCFGCTSVFRMSTAWVVSGIIDLWRPWERSSPMLMLDSMTQKQMQKNSRRTFFFVLKPSRRGVGCSRLLTCCIRDSH